MRNRGDTILITGVRKLPLRHSGECPAPPVGAEREKYSVWHPRIADKWWTQGDQSIYNVDTFVVAY